MKKQVLTGLLAGALLSAILPGAASADGPKDRVSGTATFEIDDSRATVRAESDANGDSARGTYRIVVDDPDPALTSDPTLSFSADVVCLHVDGNEAVVGAVVSASSDETAVPVTTGLLHYVVDNGPPGAIDASITVFGPAGACADVLPFPIDPQPVRTGNWIVRDR